MEHPKDLEAWLLSFENACDALGVPESKRKLVCLTYFRGYLAVWAARKKEQNPDSTWTEFKILLDQEFIDANKSTRAQDQLLTARQKYEESIQQYVHRFRRLVILSGVNPDEDLVVRTFINGISNNLVRANVSVLKPDTFETAVSHATKCAVALGQGRGNPTSSYSSSSNPRNQRFRSRFNRKKSEFRRHFSASTRRSDSSSNDNPMKKGKFQGVRCYFCNERGHIAPRCPQKRQQKPNTNAVAMDQDQQSGND